MYSRASLLIAAAAALVAAIAVHAQAPAMNVRVTFNPTPSPSWNPHVKVTLNVDARRNPAIEQEDIFARQDYGVRERAPGQTFDFPVSGAHPGENIIIQGYMCAYGGTGDCYPSDKSNPPSCSVLVKVQPGFSPSCSPVFTWSGGLPGQPVLCSAECR